MKIKSLFLIPLLLIMGCKDKMDYNPKKLDPNTNYDDVYIIMGQSNATGVAEHSYLEASHPEIYQKYSVGDSNTLISFDVDGRVEGEFVPTKFGYGHDEKYFGPEIGIADELSKQNKTSYIIKATYSGSCLLSEYVNQRGEKLYLYRQYIKFIQGQLKKLENNGKTPRIRGLFWMQGESDSFLTNANRYYDGENYFYRYLRSDLNNWIYDHFNFVDAYIFTKGELWINPELINACKEQMALSYEHYYTIKTNGEDEEAITLHIKSETGEEDDLAHYDSNSMLLLGQSAAKYLLK